MRYVYSVVRFVPDPARGEYVNVGLIVGSDETSEWQVRQLDNAARARAIDDNQTLGAAWEFLGRIGRDLDRFEMSVESIGTDAAVDISEEWLRQLADRHTRIVQLSDPAPIVADGVQEACDILETELLVSPARGHLGFKTKHAALAAVRGAYKMHGLKKGTQVFERVTLQSERYKGYLDFAIANGRVVQLAQTWSFQVPDQETLAEQVKAWAWTVHELRASGGQVRMPDRALNVRPDISLEVVIIHPQEGQPAPALDTGLAIFEEVNADVVDFLEVNRVAEKAAKLLAPE